MQSRSTIAPETFQLQILQLASRKAGNLDDKEKKTSPISL